MNPDKINEYRIQELVDKLNYHTKLYDEGRPEISDKEWDDMYFELQDLENSYNIYYEDSPTQKVNFQVVNELKKITHNHPMLSLDKTKDLNEIRKFVYNNDYVAMAKMDGLTCSLKYINGKLISAETRGNGLVGEDILHNALQVKNIPNKINFKDELIIDGEIICTYENFKEFESEYKNPRNFASGSIRLLDSKESSMRKLSFIAWDCIKGLNELTLLGKLCKLSDFGFTIVPTRRDISNYNIEKVIKNIQLDCQKRGYPIDGVVFKYNKCSEYEAAGRTDHHFKGGIAYKFYDEEYETTLKDIEWTMGRTGVLTPVAILEPIEIDGTEVSRANLHNISVMKELGVIHKNCRVLVYKANMIIPQISQVVASDTHEVIKVPKVCPICGGNTEIIKEIDSEMLYCGNPQCEGKLINKLEHFTDMKKGIAIKGISKATLEKLIDWGWMSDISDFFSLHTYRDEWIKKDGFGEKSVDKILDAIEASRNCKLEDFISAIGIPLIGLSNAKEICKHIEDFQDLYYKCQNGFEFERWAGFGYEKAEALRNFDFCEACLTYPLLNIETQKEEEKEQSLAGLTFCVTGKVKIWKNRDELSAAIEALGGKVTGSVTKNTNYLINNDVNSTSAKNNKAKELNIKIIDEQTFMDMFDIKK